MGEAAQHHQDESVSGYWNGKSVPGICARRSDSAPTRFFGIVDIEAWDNVPQRPYTAPRLPRLALLSVQFDRRRVCQSLASLTARTDPPLAPSRSPIRASLPSLTSDRSHRHIMGDYKQNQHQGVRDRCLPGRLRRSCGGLMGMCRASTANNRATASSSTARAAPRATTASNRSTLSSRTGRRVRLGSLGVWALLTCDVAQRASTVDRHKATPSSKATAAILSRVATDRYGVVCR
jgi:hypothetical protein